MRVSSSSLIMATMSLSVSRMVVSEALGLEASVKSGAPGSKFRSVWQCGMNWAGHKLAKVCRAIRSASLHTCRHSKLQS